MKRKNELLIVLCSICLLLAGAACFLFSSMTPPQEIKTDLWPADMVEFHYQGDSPPHLDMPVSITPFDDAHYLVTDYSSIFLLDCASGDLTDLKPGTGELSRSRDMTMPGSKCISYHPTGIHFSKKNNLLYVANYAGNDILVFSASLGEKRISLVDEIHSPHTISPENVFVSDDGSCLVSANYDGGSVSCFTLCTTPPRELWNTPIGQAHGICIVGKKAYATGLQPPCIIELDLQTGKILRKTGIPGWHPGENNFLWPTSIYPFSSRELIVSDAHTGFISIMEKHSLKVKKYFGGNGPTYHFLNMPYSAITDGNRLIVISTFQGRILIGDKKSCLFERALVPCRDAWVYARTRQPDATMRLGEGWKDYVLEKGPPASILGCPYMPGYGHLHPKGSAKSPILTLSMNADSLFNRTGSEFFFMQYRKSSSGLLLFSPQSTQAFLLTGSPVSYLFTVPLEKDCWVMDDAVISAGGPVDGEKIEGDFIEKAGELDRKRLPSGLLRPEDLRAVAFPFYDSSLFEKKLLCVFSSAQGRRFLDEYRHSLANNSSRRDVEKFSQEYYAAIRQEDFAHFDEMLLVHMLSGAIPRP
jgi:hypothetical protein